MEWENSESLGEGRHVEEKKKLKVPLGRVKKKKTPTGWREGKKKRKARGNDVFLLHRKRTS